MVLSCCIVPISAQTNIATYNFDQFSQFLNNDDDTTYVINFWATWCAPCVKELPYFEDLNQEYSEEAVKVLLVSLDFENQIEKKLVPFLKEKQLESEVVVLVDSDANRWISAIHDEWSGVIPATLIYNNKNKKFIEGEFSSYAELKSMVHNFK